MAGRGSGWINEKKVKQQQKEKRIRAGRRPHLPTIHLPAWMEWYDMVMIPVMIIAAVLVVINIEDVLLAFFKVTVVVLDMLILAMAVVGVGVLVLVLLSFRRRR